jgi:hypothetical protein
LNFLLNFPGVTRSFPSSWNGFLIPLTN